MSLVDFFLSFLQPVGVGAAIVIALILIIRLGIPRRSVSVIPRRTPE